MEPNEPILYKADLRDISGDGTFVSAITAISPQFSLRDEALAVGKKMIFPVTADTFFVLVPILGGVDIVSQEGLSDFAGPHDLSSFFCKAGTNFILFNPFQEHVNVLLASFQFSGFSQEAGFHKSVFSLEERNTLQNLEANGPRMAIGIYDNSKEALFETSNPFVAFVLNGSFQSGKNTLGSRDALLIPDAEKITFTALSDDAILFLAELPS